MKHHLHRHKATIFSLSLLAVVIVAGFTITEFRKAVVVQAGATDNFTGFAWSDMPNGSDEVMNPTGLTVGRGAGWISFNSTDTGSAVDYGVNVDASGNITGNAWSEHVGWITFGPSTGCPGGICASYINLSTGVFSGWARAVSGSTAESGGWDGWISLATNGFAGPAYGWTVNISTGVVTGSAWGGDVLGWITPYNVTIALPPVLSPLTLTANPSTISACTTPAVTDLIYASPANLPFTNCTVTSSPTGTNVHNDTMPADHALPTASNQTIGGVSVVAPSTTYTLSCTGTGIPTATTSATANVAACVPTATLGGQGCFQTAPSPATLTWTSSNMTSCSIDHGVGSVALNGSTVVTVSGSITYTLTCTGSYGSVSSQHLITISPTCSNPGGSSGGPITPIFQEV